MAQMIPDKLSSTTNSNAEKKLFHLFKQSLSSDYIVFHGAWWHYKSYFVQDSEADFLVIHPNKGILVVEVKGGEIKYDPINKAWYQNQYQMKISPFEQARKIKYKLFHFLSEHNEFKLQNFFIGYCVAFPDVDNVINGLPSEAPQQILMLRPQLKDINNWIFSIFDYYKINKNMILGQERTRKIIELISPSTEFKKYIANDIEVIHEEIIQLTEQQYNILNYLQYHFKCIVLGCAGSGKTQLAIEKARRLCQHKVKTIVVCKSNNLSLYLASSLEQESQAGYCRVFSYEKFTRESCILNFDFAAIIVDEGQDFEYQEIKMLSKFIPEDGIFYIFQDSNQNISKNANKFALPVSPITLDKNCRNTHKIFTYASPFVSCKYQIKSSFIEGKDVVQRIYKEQNEIFKLLEEDIIFLVKDEQISPAQIIILTDMYPLSKSILSEYSHIDDFYLAQYSFFINDKNIIQWSNIGMYKGLESDVVIILFEKHKTVIPNNWDIANRYVGSTRARSFLIIYDSIDPEIDF